LIALVACTQIGSASGSPTKAEIAPHAVNDDTGLVSLATLTLRPRATGDYLADGRMTVTLSDRSPADIVLAVFGIRCTAPSAEVPSVAQAFSQSQNLVRGQSVTLQPQDLVTLAGGHTWRCSLVMRFSRPRQPVGPNRVDVGPGATFALNGPLRPGPIRRLGVKSALLLPGTTIVPIETHWTIRRPHRTLTLIAEFELTACTAVSGSRDATTGGRELCQGFKDAAKPGVAKVQLIARRRTLRRGVSCLMMRAPRTALSARIDAATHHKVITLSRTLTLSPHAGCSSSVDVWLRITAGRGTAIVFNATASLLMVIPRA
jgi:hypothetical protein